MEKRKPNDLPPEQCLAVDTDTLCKLLWERKDTRKVFLCLDSDTAGSEACTRLAQSKMCIRDRCRDVFPWGTKHHPEINKLFLTMEQQPGQVPGSHFKVHAPGDSFMFSHPVSGITHIMLSVL